MCIRDRLDTRFSRFSKINMDDSFDEDFSEIGDDDFDTIDFLDDEEDDDEISDEPLPFSSSENLDDSDSYQASSSKADSSKERSAIDEAPVSYTHLDVYKIQLKDAL